MCATFSHSPGSLRLGSALSSDTEVQQNSPSSRTGQWEPSTKGNVGQVAFQAGHFCPYLTGSPCIACALNSPVSSAFILSTYLSPPLFIENPSTKKPNGTPPSLSPHLASVTTIKGLAVRVNCSQSPVKVGRVRVFGAKLQEQIHSLLHSSKTNRGFNFQTELFMLHRYLLLKEDFTSAKLFLRQFLELTLSAILFLVLSYNSKLHNESPNISNVMLRTRSKEW